MGLMFGKNLRSNERGSAAVYLILTVLILALLAVIFFELGVTGLVAMMAVLGGIALAIFGPRPYSWAAGALIAIVGIVLFFVTFMSSAGGLGI